MEKIRMIYIYISNIVLMCRRLCACTPQKQVHSNTLNMWNTVTAILCILTWIFESMGFKSKWLSS